MAKIKPRNKLKKSILNFRYPRLWYLTVKNLKTMFRDRIALAWIIGYPLFFIVIFAVAFGEAETNTYEIVIFNDDDDGVPSAENPVADASYILEDVLEDDFEDTIIINEDLNHKEAKEELKYQRIDAIIEIDMYFSEAIFNITGYENTAPKVEIKTIPDEIVESVIGSIISQIVDEIISKYNNITKADINSKQATNSVDLEVIDYMAPGFIIAGVLVCVNQLASHFAEENEKGTLKRLTTTPVSRRDIILSGMLSQLVVAAFQIIVMLIISTQVFGVYVHPDTNLLLLFLIPMLFSFTCLGIGLILASFMKSSSSIGLVWLIILPLQFLGGVFTYGVNIPLGEYIPTTYANHAMRLVMTSGLTSWEAIGMDIMFLIGTGIAFTIIGVLLFQRKTAVS
ncbi:MAG: ABC transporter permease [Promethearchaeota archaeon]